MTNTDESHRPTGAPFSENENYLFLRRAIDELDGLTVPTDAKLVAWMPSPVGKSKDRRHIAIVLVVRTTVLPTKSGTAYLIVTAIHHSDDDTFGDAKNEILENLGDSALLSIIQKGCLTALTNQEVRMLPDIPFWERAIIAAEQRNAEKPTDQSFPDLRDDIPLYSGIDPRAETTASMLLVCRNRVTEMITTLSTDRLDGDVPDSIMWDSGDSLTAVETDLGTAIVGALKWFSAFDMRDKQ